MNGRRNVRHAADATLPLEQALQQRQHFIAGLNYYDIYSIRLQQTSMNPANFCQLQRIIVVVAAVGGGGGLSFGSCSCSMK